MKLDETDKQIIRLLQQNARIPNTEIARSLGVTETTVRNRVARMLDEGSINFVAVVNPEATEATISAFLQVGVKPIDMDHVVSALQARPEVRYLALTLGRVQVVIEAFFRDHEHMLSFQNETIGSLPGVHLVETNVVVRVPKMSYEWEI